MSATGTEGVSEGVSCSPRIMITGAGGFIGSRVAHVAQRLGEPAGLRLLAHRRPVSAPAPSVEIVVGDLADAASLAGLCDGVDVLLHCASVVGGSRTDCEAVNARGTGALVAEARRAGVSRIVYISTASVYGRGDFSCARPEDLARAPGSDTSRTRAAAEDVVLAADGIVLRPHMIYGAGDRWVAPGLVRLLQALGADIGEWPALLSLVEVDDLAQVVIATALAPAEDLRSRVYHANHPRPVRCADLVRTVARTARLPRPVEQIDYAQARARLQKLGMTTQALDMVATDHWFDSSPLWNDLRRDPGPGFPERFSSHAAWYEEQLTPQS